MHPKYIYFKKIIKAVLFISIFGDADVILKAVCFTDAENVPILISSGKSFRQITEAIP